MDQPVDIDKFEFPGNYRAIVEDNLDPHNAGRVRVRILGVHSIDPKETPVGDLPWAEPCLPIYYSGGKNLENKSDGNGSRYTPDGTTFTPPKRATEDFVEKYSDSVLKSLGTGGIYSVPRKGTMVWVFFDVHNHMRPQYWSAAPKKTDWTKQRAKLDNDIKTKKSEIGEIKTLFTPDKVTHSGSSCAADAKIKTFLNKPRMEIKDLQGVENAHITSYTSPGGVTYITVNKDGVERTYITHKGYLEYTDDKGQRKILVGKTDGKNNDLEQTIANNFELHIGGDFDTYVHKSHFIQVDGDAQITVKGNTGIYAGKDIDLVSNGSINIDAAKNINFHAKGAIQLHAEKDYTAHVDGDYTLQVKKNFDVAINLSAKIKSLDLHIKAKTNQIFETGLTQTLISNVHMAKSTVLYAIASDAVLRINAGAAIQQSAAAIDVGGAVVNVGGVVALGAATSNPPPTIVAPPTDAETIVNQKKFTFSKTPKNQSENDPNS